jgi:TRAP-type uncharacterized transport system fused permease subunit
VIGVIALAAGLHAYLLAALSIWQRAVLFIAAILLIVPELISSLFGLLLRAAIAINQGLLSRTKVTASGFATK